MLILTEKPSVAKDFARALGCNFNSAERCFCSADRSINITNCVGHLFELEDPVHYGSGFKNWKNLPVIPDEFDYRINPDVKDTADLVIRLLKKHKADEILIATDADREGEIIARECLDAAGIIDHSRIRRFWVSQALTPEVIKDGISKARPLGSYDMLASQGFARQRSDWLVGMNATRFITNRSTSVLPVGRVQTAILAAIEERCGEIDDFRSERYYEIHGIFSSYATQVAKNGLKGTLLKDNGSARFDDPSDVKNLSTCLTAKAVMKEIRKEKKAVLPLQLYNLNDLQKDAFHFFGYSAGKTLKDVQKLYEEYKCVSYPRTPSRVMGSQNVQLCSNLHQKLMRAYPEYLELHSVCRINETNRRIFDDSKLEAHHAIIPLKKLPPNATDDEGNIYFLILERFMLVSAPVHEYEKQTVRLDVKGNQLILEGRKVIDEGWKRYRRFTAGFDSGNEEKFQSLDGIDWNDLYLQKCEAEEKHTRPPKHFNEASILAFMENPECDDDGLKLIGLGTPATRHTFIPKLLKSKYIEVKGSSILVTDLGKKVLELVKGSPLRKLADIKETTRWEEELSADPERFLYEIKDFIRSAVTAGKGGTANE